MLLELNVREFGIIENSHWELQPGLNVITGETGAGKSLVIDAVEALLGGRIDSESVRHGGEEATIEGIFDLTNKDLNETIIETLSEKGISIEDETLIVSCSIRKQGRAVFRVNGQAVPRNSVHELGRLFIDIHGQSEHLELLNKKYHLDFLDAFGNAKGLLREFTENLTELRSIEQEMDKLTAEMSDRARREDFLCFQTGEIREANLREGEEEELEQEHQILSSVETIKSLSHQIYQTLSGEDAGLSSTLDRLHQAERSIRELIEHDTRLKEQADLLEEALYNLEEVARDVYSYGDSLEYDPARLAEIESRLELIRSLKYKYGDSISDVLGFLKQAEAELEEISCSGERQSELEARRESVKQEMGKISSELSEARAAAAQSLVSSVVQELNDLGMGEMVFDVAVRPVQGDETITLPSGEELAFGNEGIDSVEFMASTNPGEPLKPLAKIASTGESSRFMLALKGSLSRSDNIPVVVFDEIDIGVGGRSGEVLGKKLWALARDRQVVCVTHLPQIAALADSHFGVHKEFAKDRTSSILQKLDPEARLEEIATMLAGPDFSEAALDSARELLDKAETWRNDHLQAGGGN